MLITGFAPAALAQIETGRVNCITTSPPYWGLRDYGLPGIDWPALEYAPMAGLPPVSVEAWHGCFGLEPTQEMYIGHLVLIWRELGRVLRDDGVCFLNLGDSYVLSNSAQVTQTIDVNTSPAGVALRPPVPVGVPAKNLVGIPWRAAFALQADGWYLRSDIIWHKPSPMPESVRDRPTKAHEYIFLLARSERYWYDAEAVREKGGGYNGSTFTSGKTFKAANSLTPVGQRPRIETGTRNRRSVWTVAGANFKEAHFAVFPPALIEPCILAGCPPQVCAECGEPWVRVVEREKMEVRPGPSREAREKQGLRTQTNGTMIKPPTTTTLHWSPTCAHADASTRPGIVLDPFLGSGTTARVAIQHNRDWIGIEPNPEYGELVNKRLNGVQRQLF